MAEILLLFLSWATLQSAWYFCILTELLGQIGECVRTWTTVSYSKTQRTMVRIHAISCGAVLNEFVKRVKVTPPKGGSFLWITIHIPVENWQTLPWRKAYFG